MALRQSRTIVSFHGRFLSSFSSIGCHARRPRNWSHCSRRNGGTTDARGLRMGIG
jgi:hypothetical protein